MSVQVFSLRYINNLFCVSIHHMCRFKKLVFCAYIGCNSVSIHHMCRFKFIDFETKSYIFHVSIHHMCRFKMALLVVLGIFIPSFNTSYVSVQVSV